MTHIREVIHEVTAGLLPVVLIVMILHFSVTEPSTDILIRFLTAVIMVYMGLILFLLGVRHSLLPLGRLIGNQLPYLGTITRVLFATLLLGFFATLAEPDLRVLSKLVTIATNGAVGQELVIGVSLGVGVFLALAIYRLVFGMSMRLIMTIGLTVILLLTLLTPEFFVAVAFDAGAVTTGPVTVPFMLALGAGMSAVLRSRQTLSNSFGLIGIASLGPVIAVLLMGVLQR